jgi:DNA-directed RNA polymerase sigma subunit (sigma70/sigma32)
MSVHIEPIAARARAAIAEAIPRRGECLQLRADLSGVLTVLTARGRRIVMARYGVGGPQMTLDDVGDSLSLTAEPVHQIERAALDKLREAMTRGRRVT